jgi:hypothetical protein
VTFSAFGTTTFAMEITSVLSGWIGTGAPE